MLLFMTVNIAVIAAAVFLSRGNSETVMDEYCRLECKESRIQDYSICC